MLFDTRFFLAVFTSRDPGRTERLMSLLARSEPAYTSSIAIYEVYRVTLANEGKDVAKLRSDTIEKQFNVVDVDPEIAKEGADIGHRLRVPMGDALIMATAKRLRLPCVTDDPHFVESKRVWI